MKSNEYHFVTRWRVRAAASAVYDLLGDPLDLPRWWPEVYLDAREIEPPTQPSGVGRVVRLRTKGFLPYRLDWSFRVTEVAPHTGFALRASGDFVGEGRWRFVPDGDWLDVEFDWRVAARKPLLRRLSFALRPLFAWNHEWAMRRGREALERELARHAA